MARRAVSKTSVKRIQEAEQKRQALELRKAGVGFQAIADRLGYKNASGAHYAVMSALHEVIKPAAQDVIDLEIERLDAMIFAIWPQVRAGNLGAIDRMLRLMERRAKYQGLDQPTKVDLRAVVAELSATFGLTEDESGALHRDINAYLASARAVPGGG